MFLDIAIDSASTEKQELQLTMESRKNISRKKDNFSRQKTKTEAFRKNAILTMR